MVKRFMRRHSSVDPVYAGLPEIPAHAQPLLKLVGKSIEPEPAEIAANPRARSAKLRAAERTGASARAAMIEPLLPRLPSLADVLRGRG